MPARWALAATTAAFFGVAGVAYPQAAAAPTARSGAPARDGGVAAEGGAGCGTAPLPDCPLQGWMKAHATPPILAKRFADLEETLLFIAAMAPPAAAYPNWVSIARDGVDAAHEQHYDGVKAACRGCHEQYRAKYRAELRDRPLPTLPPATAGGP